MNSGIMYCSIVGLAGSLLVGCAAGDRPGQWAGTVDTLASGQVVVRNPAEGLWRLGEEWRVVEELRIGSMEGNGPDLFGQINSLAVDPMGRIWVLDGQAQEIRVFDTDGEYVRTIGRKGGGPGEFAQAVHVGMAHGGNVWVADPQNNRVSVFDTSGTYVEGKEMKGGFIIQPWPGRFDGRGRYYLPVPDMSASEFRISFVAYDSAFQPVDTLVMPKDPIERVRFRHESPDGRSRMMAGVPYQGSLTSFLSRTGTEWALVTDQYRMFELTSRGDTLRTITREFEPLPVTDADREKARQDLEWFTKQGGEVDWSRIPDTKPPVTGFFQDDEGDLWVRRTIATDATDRRFDVFDPEGRYLGVVTVPFPLVDDAPLFEHGVMYGEIRDELEVPYVVRARIEKPAMLLGEAGAEPDEGIEEALDLLVSKRGRDGMWKMVGGLNGKMHADLDARGEPSPWITYRALLALRRFGRLAPGAVPLAAQPPG